MANATTPETYDERFYSQQADGSRRSASVILPLVFSLVGKPRHIVDFGCGVGAWLTAAQDLGVTDYLGIDGDYVTHLEIPPERFMAADISNPVRLERRFDMALSMEVAEHIPPSAADAYVENVALLADVILFSAALPGQGGTRHFNEQWPEYWAGKFAAHGYSAYDCIRSRIWDDTSVEFWYRQNVLLFISDKAASAYAGAGSPSLRPLSLVHPELLRLWQDKLRYNTWAAFEDGVPPLRDSIRYFFRSGTRFLSRRLGRRH